MLLEEASWFLPVRWRSKWGVVGCLVSVDRISVPCVQLTGRLFLKQAAGDIGRAAKLSSDKLRGTPVMRNLPVAPPANSGHFWPSRASQLAGVIDNTPFSAMGAGSGFASGRMRCASVPGCCTALAPDFGEAWLANGVKLLPIMRRQLCDAQRQLPQLLNQLFVFTWKVTLESHKAFLSRSNFETKNITRSVMAHDWEKQAAKHAATSSSPTTALRL